MKLPESTRMGNKGVRHAAAERHAPHETVRRHGAAAGEGADLTSRFDGSRQDMSVEQLHELVDHLQRRIEELEQSSSPRAGRLPSETLPIHHIVEVYDAVSLACVTVDGEGRILSANATAGRRLGTTPSATCGRELHRFAVPDDADRCAAYLHDVFKADSVQFCEVEMIGARGTRFVCRLQGQVLEHMDRPRCLVVLTDVTERHRAEVALRRSEDLQRKVLETVPTGVWVADRAFRVQFWNKAQETMTGIRREEILGLNMLDRFPSLEESGLAELYRRVMSTGKPFVLMGYPFRDPSLPRQSYYLNITAKALLGDSGDIAGIVVAVDDITERKRAEAAVRESEQRFRTLVQNIPGVVYLCENDERYTMQYVSSGVEELTGVPAEEFLAGRASIVDLMHPEDLAQIRHAVAKGLAADRPFNIVYRIRHADGDWRWVEEHGQGVVDDQGGLLFLEGTLLDITSRMRMEQERERTWQLLQQMIDGASDPIMLMSPDYRVLLMNRAARDMHDVRDGGEPVRCHELLHGSSRPCGEDGMKCPIDQVRQTGKPAIIEHEHVGPDGERRTLEIVMSPLRDDSGVFTGFIESSRDITDRRRMEDELRRMQRLESIGLLAGGIAHDFNNLFMGIIGNVSLAKLAAPFGSEVHAILSQTEEACGRARNLTQQLLTFAKGGAPVTRVVQIGDLMRDWIGFALRGSNVRCEFEFAPDLWAVEVDDGQVSQVINNVAINALQAMPSGGLVRVAGRNLPDAEQARLPLKPGRYVHLSIQDNGPGIPRKHLEQIFDPYFTTKQTGSGLGLAVSYSIVQKHGGLITADSTDGEGSTFDIYLPAAGDTATPVAVGKARLVRGTGRILVMDDEESIRSVAKAMLERIGYTADCAVDGADAIEKYRAALEAGRRFDAVILDLTIPGGMGGREAVEALQAIDPEICAIVSSGYSTDPIMADHMQYGFAAVVAKPYTVAQLSSVLSGVLGSQAD